VAAESIRNGILRPDADYLNAHGEELLKQQLERSAGSSPEEIVERALETLAGTQPARREGRHRLKRWMTSSNCAKASLSVV
jgi:hypothetical protein